MDVPSVRVSSSSPLGELQSQQNTQHQLLEVRIKTVSSKLGEELENVEMRMLSSAKIESNLRSIQYYINDLVLKGTCAAIPFIAPSAPELTPQYLDLVINTLDIGIGIPNLVLKVRMLQKSQEILTELRKNQTLSPSQSKRLEQLEKAVSYQKSLLSDVLVEQGLRISRSALTNVQLATEVVPQLSSFLDTLAIPLDFLIRGVNTLISGLFLQRACSHRRLQDRWFKENHATFLPPLMRKEQMTALLEKRKKEQEQLKEKVSEKSLHHATIDPIIKGSLVEMVKKKHEIERKFLDFKVNQYGTSLLFALIGVSVALLLAVVATPIGAAATIFLVLNISSMASSMLFFTGMNLLSYQYKPGLTTASFKGAYIKLIFYYAMSYLQSAKDSIASHFSKNSPPNLQNGAQSWLKKAAELNEELEQIAWQDFAHQAGLKVAHPHANKKEWDTLEALNEALSQCQFHLLRPETRELLEKQLGLDCSLIEEQLEKDPLIIKKTLRNFFNLGNTAFMEFLGKQRGSAS